MRHFLTIFDGQYYGIGARITQSCLESLFSHVRQLGGGNNNPTESAYSGAIASIRIMNEEFIGGGSGDRSSCAALSPENVPRFTTGALTREDPRRKVVPQASYIPVAIPQSPIGQRYVSVFLCVYDELLNHPRFFALSGTYPSISQFETLVKLITLYGFQSE